MDFPDALGPRDSMPEPERIMSGQTSADDRACVEESASAAGHVAESLSANVVSLEAMRSNVLTNRASFEPDDLDVPAFLRKRNEVM